MGVDAALVVGASVASVGSLIGSAGVWARGKAARLAGLERATPESLCRSSSTSAAAPAPSTPPPPTPPTPRLVALTGVAAAPAPLACELDATGALRAAITTLREEALSLAHLPNGRWVREAHTLRAATREAAGWGVGGAGQAAAAASPLLAGSSPSTSAAATIIPVLAATAAPSLPLSPVGDAISSPPASPAPLTLLDSLLGRRPLGTRRVEAALAVGTPLTVVGEVVEMEAAPGRASEDGRPGRGRERPSPTRRRLLAIRPPPPASGLPFLLTTRPFDAVVAEATAAVDAAVRVGGATAALGLAIALAGRGLRAWRRRSVARRAAAARARVAAARAARAAAAAAACGGDPPPPPDDGDGDTPSSPSTCVVCLDAPADTCWAPCGHLCACGECAARTGAKCPVCRGRGRALRVFRT